MAKSLRLEACKAYKEETGVSLTDAKKTVEAYIYGYRTPCKMDGSISFQHSTNQSLGDSKH